MAGTELIFLLNQKPVVNFMKKVELYVTSEKHFLPDKYQERVCEHTASGQVDISRPESKLRFAKTKELFESDKEALKIVSEIAKEKGWKVEVYDLSSLVGGLRARLKGVNKTPMMFIDDHKIGGVPKREHLLSF